MSGTRAIPQTAGHPRAWHVVLLKENLTVIDLGPQEPGSPVPRQPQQRVLSQPLAQGGLKMP